MDISVLAIIEQGPDISDKELKEYIIIYHKSKRVLCAIEEEIQIPEEYREYQDVFEPPKDGELSVYGLFDHEIRLKKDQEPIFKPIYQLSELESKTLKKYIEKNLKKGYIRKSSSSAGYFIIFVNKKDGSL